MKVRINICDKPITDNQNINHNNNTSAELNVNVMNAVYVTSRRDVKLITVYYDALLSYSADCCV